MLLPSHTTHTCQLAASLTAGCQNTVRKKVAVNVLLQHCLTVCTKICLRVKTVCCMVQLCYERRGHVHHEKRKKKVCWRIFYVVHLQQMWQLRKAVRVWWTTDEQILWTAPSLQSLLCHILIALIQTVFYFHASTCPIPSFLWGLRSMQQDAPSLTHSYSFSLFVTIALLLQKQPEWGRQQITWKHREQDRSDAFIESFEAFLEEVRRFSSFLRAHAAMRFIYMTASVPVKPSCEVQ